ncbi:MAG: HNH endonuclease [Actinobacteria bacterium]|nr:HNH endonuclease [Actinomycetota bacterium]
MGAKGHKSDPKYKSAQDYLGTGKEITSHKLKLKLIRDGIKEARCEGCGRDTWLDQPISLELHHVDGDRFNNSLENLEILCPNCHSQKPGNSGRNVGNYCNHG